jgi:cell division protein FtsA
VIVSIPGLRGREPKEISLKNLASIIQARMEEIIDLVYQEIRSSGYEKKLIGGIVITGGGAQLRHIVQLVEYHTGMDTRIGYPNEHLAKGSDELKSPMYATGVGLVIKGFHELERKRQSQVAAQQPSASVPETANRNSAGKSAKEEKAKVAQPTEDNNKRGFIKSILEKIFDEDDSDQPLN